MNHQTTTDNNNIFGRLRQISHHVEKNLGELVRDPSDINAQTVAASALCEIRSEVNNIEDEVDRLMSEVASGRGSSNFGDRLAKYRAMHEYNVKRGDQIECYLQQYGYLPFGKDPGHSDDPQKPAVENREDSDKENCELPAKGDSCSQSTPEPDDRGRQQPEGGATPKLCDFGISRTTIDFFNKMDRPRAEPPLSAGGPQHHPTASQTGGEVTSNPSLTPFTPAARARRGGGHAQLESPKLPNLRTPGLRARFLEAGRGHYPLSPAQPSLTERGKVHPPAPLAFKMPPQTCPVGTQSMGVVGQAPPTALARPQPDPVPPNLDVLVDPTMFLQSLACSANEMPVSPTLTLNYTNYTTNYPHLDFNRHLETQ